MPKSNQKLANRNQRVRLKVPEDLPNRKAKGKKIMIALTSDDTTKLFKAVRTHMMNKRNKRMGNASVVIELCKLYTKENTNGINDK